MTTFTVTFGSFGDFVSLFQLVLTVRQALVDIDTSSEDIAAAIAGIDSFTLALNGIRAYLAENGEIPPCIQDGVGKALCACKRALERVSERLAPHRRRMERAHGPHAWRRYWEICAWVILGGRAEVSVLKERLADQIVVLQTYVGIMQSAMLDKIRQSATESACNTAESVIGLSTEIGNLVASVTRLPPQVKSHIPPFQFFDRKGRAKDPLLLLPWTVSQLHKLLKLGVIPRMSKNFTDFWEQHDFSGDPSKIPIRMLHKIFYASPSAGGKLWFELYVCEDPRHFGQLTAAISPVYCTMGPGDEPDVSTALSEVFRASALWLDKSLDASAFSSAPLLGVRNRQQFLLVEYGWDGTYRASLHTRQYLLYASPGLPQPSGQVSCLFSHSPRGLPTNDFPGTGGTEIEHWDAISELVPSHIDQSRP